jgi:hypothetical protein
LNFNKKEEIMMNLLLVFLMALTTNNLPSLPSFGGGGPDAYGYRWLDSDTVCPGAPTFNWISINRIGTRITGLADDNVVGPFSIGFEFPYYWYRVNRFYLGSNGYIAFDDNFLSAHPFQNVPNPSRPNNVLAPLMCDLDPGSGGSVWYWTNNRDTCIIEFDSVPFWNTGGMNSFQIILSKNDSIIRFQYLIQNGQPYGGWRSTGSSTIGIENVVGQVGLSYMHAGLPDYNLPHANLAIIFIPPESTNYVVNDMACWYVMNEQSEGIFIYQGDTVVLRGAIKNTGNRQASNFPVYCWVRSMPAGTIVLADTLRIDAMTPGEIREITFNRRWVPTTTGQYAIDIKTGLTGDMVPNNDQIRLEARVVSYPGELRYEDLASPHGMWAWNGPGGYGAHFVPPRYPCRITQVKIYASATSATPISVLILKDNGPNNSPGETLYLTQTTISTQQWYNINVSPAVVINSGGFFVGGISNISNQPSFGMDTLNTPSRQTWEYTTSWAKYRTADKHDVMIRAVVEMVPGVEEEISASPLRRNENWVMKADEWKALKKKGYELFNVNGQKISQIEKEGIYFLKEKEHYRKIIILH